MTPIKLTARERAQVLRAAELIASHDIFLFVETGGLDEALWRKLKRFLRWPAFDSPEWAGIPGLSMDEKRDLKVLWLLLFREACR